MIQLSSGAEFLEFSERDKIRLVEAYAIIKPKIVSIVDEFYESLRQIGAHPSQFGAEVGTLRLQQQAHWDHLFSGNFDQEYRNHARRIAIRHVEIGLPHDLYVLSYMKISILFHRVIHDTPGIDHKIAYEMNEAVCKAIAIDMVHALSAYTADLV